MRILRTIFISLGILITIPLVVALFVKSTYQVEREIVVNKSKAEVFNYVKYVKNQDHFSKWAKMDPAMKKTYKGTDGQVGFISTWKSDKKDVGQGEQEIKSITEGERIDFELRFKTPFEATDSAYFLTTAMGENQTKVVWGFDGKMPYPMNLMCLFMNMDEMVGPDLEVGLKNLKTVMEK